MHQPAQPVSPASEVADPASPAPRAGVLRWLVVLAAVILVLGPLLGTEWPHERARWLLAAGREQWLDGNLSAALAKADAAVEVAPDYPPVYQVRAQWRLDAGDYAGALADAERFLELTPRSLEGVQLKADALLHLGRTREAARTWVEFAAVPKEQYASASPTLLNAVAYYRALGDVDLETARAEIEAAIDLLRGSSVWEQAQAAFLDTRGYIEYRRKKHRSALKDLDAAVAAAERQWQMYRKAANTQQRMGLHDPRVLAKQLEELDRTTAVIRYHRALVLEALGRTGEAERDLRRVRQLGFEPGPTLF